MRAKHKTPTGHVWFCYEVHGLTFGSYDQALQEWAATHKGTIYLSGRFFSNWYSQSEVIDEKELHSRPTVSEVKSFMKGCIDYISNS